MPQLNEIDAERLSSEQAAGLIRVLELQARWENHRDDPAMSAASTPDLQARQKAFDAFQTAWNGYVSQYRQARLPEPTQNMPERLAIWSRALRAVFRRTEASYPTHVMNKVYRLVARTAARMHREPVERIASEDLAGAIRELENVIAWCDSLTKLGPVAPVLLEPKGEAA
jgi:hypothetical protein